MRYPIPVFAALLLVACATAPKAPVLKTEPYLFKARNGTEVQAELGTFEVPENRNDPKSRMISLSFVRFPSTSAHPGNPIVYLAGGPGGSGIWTAQGPRFPLFMALREVADVIALDQRGVGKSNHIPACKPETPPDPSSPLTRDSLTEYYRSELARCFAWWQSQGVDIDGYTTLQNADDLEDLRHAIGARKIDLWGISYGSHLGLAMMKYRESSVGRAVLAGIEGLDQTVKLPAETDALFERVQKIIDADPKAKAVYPDVAETMRRVHARLDARLAEVTFTPKGAKGPVTLVFDGFPVRLAASSSIADPAVIRRVPLMYAGLDRGAYEPVARLLYEYFFALNNGFAGMPEAMDLASGISAERLAVVESQAKTSLLGDALNFPMPHIAGLRPSLDLGPGFRAPFRAQTPVLFISGTLDGRTSVPAADEVARQFPNVSRLIVENGGHNIFEADPRIAEAVVAYFKGAQVPKRIRFEPPVFPVP